MVDLFVALLKIERVSERERELERVSERKRERAREIEILCGSVQMVHNIDCFHVKWGDFFASERCVTNYSIIFVSLLQIFPLFLPPRQHLKRKKWKMQKTTV